MRTKALWTVAVCAILLVASVASAGQTMCGAVSAGWNVPNGGAVFSSGPGPVKNVLQAVGEYRSHSMLSNGPGGWVTHSGSQTPPATSAAKAEWPYWTPFCSSCGNMCWNPIDSNFLYNSRPGMSQIRDGGIYEYIYGDIWWDGTGNTYNPYDGNYVYVAYQNAYSQCFNGAMGYIDNADAVGNKSWIGGAIPWTNNSVGFVYENYNGVGAYSVTHNGAKMNYGWYQYMNVENVANGYVGRNNGVVCSSALAYWQHAGLAGSAYYTGDVMPRRYSQAQIQAGANALWNSVHSECESQNGWFGSLGNFFQNLVVSAFCFDGDLCDEAADQMTNCFTSGHCGDPSSPGAYNEGEWVGIVNNPSTAASAISPDNVACWNGWGGKGAPCFGPGSSVWGYDVGNQVQWNSGGYNYSCWD